MIHTCFLCFLSSDQPEMPEGIHNRLFLLRRTMQYFSLSGSYVVVFSLLNASLILDLGNIETGDIQTVLFLNPLFDIPICRLFIRLIFALIKGNAIQINLN